MPQILTMEEVAPFIADLAEQIKKGVYDARTKKGVIMELPEEVFFEAVIVSKFQHIAISRTITRTGTEMQGGGSNEQTVLDEVSKTDGSAEEQNASQSVQNSNLKELVEGNTSNTSTNTQSTSGSTIQDQKSNSNGTEVTNQSTEQSGKDSVISRTYYSYDEKG